MFVVNSFIGLLERYQPPRGNAARFNLRCHVPLRIELDHQHINKVNSNKNSVFELKEVNALSKTGRFRSTLPTRLKKPLRISIVVDIQSRDFRFKKTQSELKKKDYSYPSYYLPF